MREPIQKAGRDSARDVLVRVGVELCTQAGFQSTGLDQILRAAGVPKGSFYHYFSSKKDFGLAVVDAYADYFRRRLQRVLTCDETPALERLELFVQEAERGMEKYGFQRGCLVGNLAQEMAGLDEDFRERLEMVLKQWESQTSRCLGEAQEAGQLDVSLDVDELAEFFWIGWEGAILRSKLTRSTRPMRVFAEGFFSFLRAN